MNHQYTARIRWSRGSDDFAGGRYSRLHSWIFDEGVSVRASSSPLSVRLPLSAADAVDPEEALVASLASCHMLFFLDFARRSGFVVENYEDNPMGEMSKNEHGHLWMSKVTLRPKIIFAPDKAPSEEVLGKLHHSAHDHCYIANSIKAEVAVERLS